MRTLWLKEESARKACLNSLFGWATITAEHVINKINTFTCGKPALAAS